MPCSACRGQRAALDVSPLISTSFEIRSLCSSPAYASLAVPQPSRYSLVFILPQEHRSYRSVLLFLVFGIKTQAFMFMQQVLYPQSHYPSAIYVFYLVYIYYTMYRIYVVHI